MIISNGSKKNQGIDSATNSKKTVLTSSTEILPATNRTQLVLQNTSANDVWVALGATAVVGEGLYLAASGGVITMNDYGTYDGVINGIADGGSADIAYMEAI